MRQACSAVRIAAAIAARATTAVLQPARGEGVLTHTVEAHVIRAGFTVVTTDRITEAGPAKTTIIGAGVAVIAIDWVVRAHTAAASVHGTSIAVLAVD